MSYHRLLQRQISKYSNEQLNSDENFIRFVEAVNNSYKSFDRDKEISEHAFATSQTEFEEMNSQLKEEIDLRRFSIKRLKATLNELNSNRLDSFADKDDDLLEIVDLLNEQMAKRKEVESQLLLAKEEAESASNAKSDFLSVISHEIRTPLNAIIGMGHLLLKGKPRPDQIENLKVLKTSSDNLLVLINDILDFNKIEAGKLDLEEAAFSVKKLINDIVNANANSASERQNQISITVDEKLPDLFIGDSLRLGQVLNNLVTNAVKFTKRGFIEVGLSLEKLKKDSAIMKIAITDTGVGIAAEDLNTIFLPFKQASSSITRKYGGTGLGLAITKRILKNLNSEIFVESELGVGSTFYFYLDLKIATDQTDHYQEGSQIEYNLERKKILLVEDTLFNVLYATQLLESWNAEVLTAENGAIAVEMMQTNICDLVLMDLQMPVMDGYTATAKIREFNIITPIIALTASATSNVREKVTKVGMQDYVNKPFNPDDFYLKLKKYLN